jgi:Uma2 family endonuclease
LSEHSKQAILSNVAGQSNQDDGIREEYDLTQLGEGVRGKYFDRYNQVTNLALLAPEVRAAFPTDEAVNEALRTVMQEKRNSNMSTLVYPTADYPVVLWPARFSSEEYLAMVDAGFLEGKRVELIDGVIVAMSPAGPQHNQFLGRLNQLLAPIWDKGEVWIQGTLSVADAQVFDPDAMLLRKKENGYKQQLPTPADVLLLIEASASSLNHDQQVKLPIYAEAGIQEYWIADLDNERLLVHREPEGAVYKSVQTLAGDALISPLAAPDFSLTVRQMFE